MVLVDTCVWIDHFHGVEDSSTRQLSTLLEEGFIATAGPVFAEIVSGARHKRERDRLEELFSALPMLEEPDGVWFRVADSRYNLARRGYQATLVDLLLAHIALHHESPFLTSDKDFQPISRLLQLELYGSS